MTVFSVSRGWGCECLCGHVWFLCAGWTNVVQLINWLIQFVQDDSGGVTPQIAYMEAFIVQTYATFGLLPAGSPVRTRLARYSIGSGE